MQNKLISANTLTSEALYLRYLHGDESGLSALIERHGDNLTFYINGYIHDFKQSEDFMIEAFSRLLVKQPFFDERGFKAYLYKIGRNLALSYIKKSRLQPCFYLEELKYEPGHSDSAEDTLINDELNQIVGKSLGQINPEYREAIYLFYYEGMSYSEAADVMKKNEKQLANLIYRGKQALKLLFEKEGITDAKYR